MPTEASSVGSLALPLEVGAANTAILDPALSGLLAYFAHWLNYDLNAKLASMAGVADEAVPSGRAYPYDPGAAFSRRDIPALYMWRSAQRNIHYSLIQDALESELTALWVFSEREVPTSVGAVAGLFHAVNSTFARATMIGRHSTFAPSGLEPGVGIREAYDLEGIEYLGAESGIIFAVPGQRAATQARANGGDGMRQRGYPSVQARWRTIELVRGRSPIDPDDVTRDTRAQLFEDDVLVRDGYLTSPDGSEEL
jgi:hypothetical protein